MRPKNPFIYFGLLLLIFAMACGITVPPTPQVVDVTTVSTNSADAGPFHIVIDPNLKMIAPLIQEVAQKQGIEDVEFEWLAGKAFEKKLSDYCQDDKKDVQLWIASTSIYMQCGKVVSSTTQLGKSVTTLAVIDDVAKQLDWPTQPTFSQVMEASQKSQLNLAMASPANDGAALQGILNAFTAVLPEPRVLLTSDVVAASPSVESFIKSLTMTAFDANNLAERILDNRKSSSPMVTAFYGSELVALRINHELMAAGLPQFRLYYIIDATGLETYPMGCSNSNSAVRKEQCTNLIKGLTDSSARSILTEQYGFRTGSGAGHHIENPTQAALDYFRPNEWGTIISYDLLITLPPKLPVIAAVAKIYQEQLKPGAFTTYVIDVSASQQGDGLKTSKAALLAVLDLISAERYGVQPGINDTMFVVFFDNGIKRVVGPIYGQDISAAKSEVEALNDGYLTGGTNIAGAVAFAQVLVDQFIKPGQIPAIILLTDGEQSCNSNCNSSAQVGDAWIEALWNDHQIGDYSDLQNFLKDGVSSPVYYIATGGADVSWMQGMTRWTDGNSADVCNAIPNNDVLSQNLTGDERRQLITDPLAQCFITFKGSN